MDMQQGLSIGIGSWIDSRHGNGGNPAFPVDAIPFKLKHMSSLHTSEDFIRAAELSLLANRVDDNGWTYGNSGIPEYLWSRYRQTLGNMETAISSLTQAERDRLAEANEILFEANGFNMSDRYAMYEETHRIYEDLVTSRGDADDIQKAYEKWVVFGHRDAIDNALAVRMNLLERESTRLIAANDISQIDVSLDSIGSDVPFLPTLFTPLSASSTEYWNDAEVDFQALEDTIRPEVSRNTWHQFRAKKSGKVHFRFIAVDLIRPWFSAMIFTKDDWRLADNQESIVADGLGGKGQLPTFYSKLYMAQIIEVENTPSAPPVHWWKPKDIVVLGNGVLGTSMLLQSRSMAAVTATQSLPVRITLQPSVMAARSMLVSTSARRGVIPRRSVLSTNLTRMTRPMAMPLRVTPVNTKLYSVIGEVGRSSKVRKLTATLAASKLEYVKALLYETKINQEPASTNEQTTYLVGFGRTNIPACPNPNPNYQWS